MDEEAEDEEAENAEAAERGSPAFIETIGRKATRVLRARREAKRPVWSGIGLMGMVGWSVAVPALAGAFLGRWLDGREADVPGTPGGRSWTLALIAAGLALGCMNAWRWVTKENSLSRDAEDERDGGASGEDAVKDGGRDGK